ncbi:hypothetical protein HDU87_002049 [Geranomyces variabilis]|uniref:FAD-binding domain-containing protein n=1 Tax=Geranomyces variabilis TaxID=109894 RepID=A0AAD5TNR6_9FUNG|nr:hypothetical protein HDU87_002049 [Geranomyces variabilis]
MHTLTVSAPAALGLRRTTSVLIVGGGLVGTTAALLLQQQAVPFILLEKSRLPSLYPRAGGVSPRTMEIFRSIGIEDEVRLAAQTAFKPGSFGGARRGASLLESRSIVNQADAIKNRMGQMDPSPCGFAGLPQTLLDPLLQEALHKRGGHVETGMEVVALRNADDGDGVEVVVRDGDGAESLVAASFLIGADGGRSFVRRALAVSSTTVDTTPPKPVTHYANLFFRADLADSMAERPFTQCAIEGAVKGLFLTVNNANQWSFHYEYNPTLESPLDFSDAKCVEIVRAAIGCGLTVEIEMLAPPSLWTTAAKVADRFRSGRIFLAGDAAHRYPPFGGMGGNTGVADVHNLCWKLAAALRNNQSSASSDLLDTYEKERRPVALRCAYQSLLRSDFSARFGIRTPANSRDVDAQIDINAALTRYRYAEPADVVDTLQCQVGTRFPHAWITLGKAGERASTLDLVDGTAGCVLIGPGGMTSRAWAVDGQKVYVTGLGFWVEEEEDGVDRKTREEMHSRWWAKVTGGLSDSGAVVVRPDGHVEARLE